MEPALQCNPVAPRLNQVETCFGLKARRLLPRDRPIDSTAAGAFTINLGGLESLTSYSFFGSISECIVSGPNSSCITA